MKNDISPVLDRLKGAVKKIEKKVTSSLKREKTVQQDLFSGTAPKPSEELLNMTFVLKDIADSCAHVLEKIKISDTGEKDDAKL